MDRRPTALIILLIVGVAVLLRLPSFFAVYPLNGDESEFLFAAYKLAHGGFPYRDFFIYHPPLIFYFYRLATWLGGDPNGLLWVRFLGAIVAGATAATLYGIAMVQGWGKSAALRAGIFSAAFGIAFLPKDMLAIHCELLAVLPMSLAVFCFLKGERDFRWGWFVAAGILVGVAGLVKYQALVALPLLLIWGLTGVKPRLIRLATCLAVTLGAIVSAGEFYGWLRIHGLLAEFWVSFMYILGYAKGPTADPSYIYLIGKCLLRLVIVAAGSLPLWILGLKAFPRHPRLVMWLVLALVATMPGGRFFYHYFILLQPPLCLLAASYAWPAKIFRRRILWAGLVIFPLAFFCYGWAEVHLQKTSAYRWIRVGEALEGKSDPGESLFVWGLEPRLYTVSHLIPATQFTTADYLTGNSPTTRGQWAALDPKRKISGWEELWIDFFGDLKIVRHVESKASIFPGARDLLVQDFQTRPPDWIVDQSTSDQAPYTAYPLTAQGWLYPWIRDNYELESTVEGFTLYRAKRPKPTTLQTNPRTRRII